MSVVVVVHTYNESRNIAELVQRVQASVPDARLLVVDDGSPDGTADLAVEAGRRHGAPVEVLRRPAKQGLGSAYMAGFDGALQTGATRVVQMDADLSHDPADLPRLLAPEADLVLGSRYVPGGGTRHWPLHRRVLSRGGSWYARLWLGLPHHDLTGGFKAWRAPLLRRLLALGPTSEGYVFQVEMTWRAVGLGASVVEVPIVFTERVGGVSKMSRQIALEAVRRVPELRLARPKP